MAKYLYCSYCGMELKHSPKAFKNRNEILHLVDPHDCDEKFIGNITDADKPISQFAKEMAEKERASASAEQRIDDNNLLMSSGDRREKDNLRKPITSTAPLGVLGQIDSNKVTSGERKMVDLDEGKGSDDGED